jgi:hypothetical protein
LRTRRVQGSLRGRSRWVAACWRQMVDRPKWSSQLLSMVLKDALHSWGRPDPRHTSRRGRIREVSRGAGLSYAADWLQRNGVLVFHIAWRMTAIFRATAMRAFLKPDASASRIPQAFSVEKRRLRVSSVVAAS